MFCVGEKYMGCWSNNMKNGCGLIVTLDGIYYEGFFVQDVLTVSRNCHIISDGLFRLLLPRRYKNSDFPNYFCAYLSLPPLSPLLAFHLSYFVIIKHVFRPLTPCIHSCSEATMIKSSKISPVSSILNIFFGPV